jgi:hypothetical protein
MGPPAGFFGMPIALVAWSCAPGLIPFAVTRASAGTPMAFLVTPVTSCGLPWRAEFTEEGRAGPVGFFSTAPGGFLRARSGSTPIRVSIGAAADPLSLAGAVPWPERAPWLRSCLRRPRRRARWLRNGCRASSSTPTTVDTPTYKLYVCASPASSRGGGAAGTGSSLLPRNMVCNAGTTTSMMIGPMSMPPTTTVASGR